MLDPPLKSDVLKQPFFDFLAGQFQLDPFGDHGIEHWLRVLINGREIAKCINVNLKVCLLYTSPSPRDRQKSRMPSSA